MPDPANPDTYDSRAVARPYPGIIPAGGPPDGWTPPGPPKKPAFFEAPGDPDYKKVLDDLNAMHLVKSAGYGTSKDRFANFTAVAAVSGRATYEYPVDRIVEKCTRVKSLIAQGMLDKIAEEFKDIAALAVCAEALRRKERRAILDAPGPRVGG